ncbi:MAG: ATP-binding protein [Candidatus Promineofilum sp.]|nr:ATP-binding protein [Promineifilum sp.]MCW5862547.1 ATP-binding protein [Anaerolineae bacterium]
MLPTLPDPNSQPTSEPLGYVVGGGLKEGFRIRLTVPADSVQEGSFVVCESGHFRYYGLVTDLQLGSTDPRFADEQSDRLPVSLRQALYGKTLYTTLAVYPTLMLDLGPDLTAPERAEWQARVDRGEENPGPRPVKTVPAHHAPVRPADAADVAAIFGEEGGANFVVGHTIEQGYPVCLDLARFVKRSSGIFGATGTGKSFLTRMVLAGLMKADVAAALVFDMHNEYGYDDRDADRDTTVRGLKAMFGQKAQIAGLGKSTRVRGASPDFTLELSTRDFGTADILLLSEALDLNETAAVTLSALERAFQRDWFAAFMALKPGAVIEDESGKKVPAGDSVAYWANGHNIHPAAAESLHRKLQPIFNRAYVVERPAADAVKAIVDQLENGRHVILSFGEYDSELDYMLVSNVLTRRIRQQWVDKTERHKSFGEAPPRPLVIAIEEAHKLLSPAIAGQTAFGTIARELRKYNVTLLIVDQRPSGIDDEVMSQLGTRVTGWLGDEDDIRAVLSGLAGREQLRGMLARLQEKEEVLLLGWGVKMPIPIRSRRYDGQFYDDMRGRTSAPLPAERYTLQRANDDLF